MATSLPLSRLTAAGNRLSADVSLAGCEIILNERLRFRSQYNVRSFAFRHELQSSPLFEWPSLLDLAARHPRDPQHVYCSRGRVVVGDRWSAHQQSEVVPTEVLRAIDESDCLLMFKRLEEDELLGPLIRSIQAKIIDLTCGALRDDLIVGRGTLLIASPRRITSYHLDSDVNFLFQIRGAKSFSVMDASGGAAVSDEELEQFFLGDLNAARYDAGRQREATVYELDAGYAVHVPCLTPHWAQNLDSPSIALSINFDLRSMMSLGRIYRLTGRLRKWGLSPRHPGTSSWRDSMKLAALDILRRRSAVN
jgi:hypothetical protein